MSDIPKATPPQGKARRSVVAQPMGNAGNPRRSAYKFPPKKSLPTEQTHLIGYRHDWDGEEDVTT
jgi:hypothetical protein